jgi:hypothetical protein
MIIALNCPRQRLLHPPPVALFEAVEPVDRGRCPGVDPAVALLSAPLFASLASDEGEQVGVELVST